MTVDHDYDTARDGDTLAVAGPRTSATAAKENNQRQLEMRRRLEDRLERRRLRDELGLDDLWELEL